MSCENPSCHVFFEAFKPPTLSALEETDLELGSLYLGAFVEASVTPELVANLVKSTTNLGTSGACCCFGWSVLLD